MFHFHSFAKFAASLSSRLPVKPLGLAGFGAEPRDKISWRLCRLPSQAAAIIGQQRACKR